MNTNTHQLTNGWSFWFEKGNSSEVSTSKRQYGENLFTVRTVENFWGFYNDFPAITTVPKGSDSYFFRENILPIQSDIQNIKGGRITFSFNLKTDEDKEKIKELWCRLMCYCIGEIFEQHDIVNGISFSMRSQARVSVWINTNDKDIAKNFVEGFRKEMSIEDKCKMFDHHTIGSPIEM
ncbi:Eukaryotic initiation factor 4E [Entamoeba marina]